MTFSPKMFVHDLMRCTAGSTCCCLSEEARIQRKINQKIEHQLRREKRNSRKHIKLLLLGTGESGKSTFIRQMRIIHEHGYETLSERTEYISKIHQNLLTTIYTIDHAMTMFQIDYCLKQNWDQVHKILKQCTNYVSVQSWKEQFFEQVSFWIFFKLIFLKLFFLAYTGRTSRKSRPLFHSYNVSSIISINSSACGTFTSESPANDSSFLE